MNQHERNRQGINHITHQQPVKAVYVKQLPAEQPGKKPLLTEGIYDCKSIGNRRKKHGKKGRRPDHPLHPTGNIGIIDRIGQKKGQDCGYQRADRCRKKTVSQRLSESAGKNYAAVMGKSRPFLSPK